LKRWGRDTLAPRCQDTTDLEAWRSIPIPIPFPITITIPTATAAAAAAAAGAAESSRSNAALQMLSIAFTHGQLHDGVDNVVVIRLQCIHRPPSAHGRLAHHQLDISRLNARLVEALLPPQRHLTNSRRNIAFVVVTLALGLALRHRRH
jgi:hypothetical protein